MGIIDYVQKYIFKNNPNEDVAEEFTAEVNRELLSQLAEKDEEIENLQQIIRDFSAEVFLSGVSALDKLYSTCLDDEGDDDEFEGDSD